MKKKKELTVEDVSTSVFGAFDSTLQEYIVGAKKDKFTERCFDFTKLAPNEFVGGQSFICGYKQPSNLIVSREQALDKKKNLKFDKNGNPVFRYFFPEQNCNISNTVFEIFIDLIPKMPYYTHANATVSDAARQSSEKNKVDLTVCIPFNQNSNIPYVVTEKNTVAPDVINAEPKAKTEKAFVMTLLYTKICSKSVYQHFMQNTHFAQRLLDRYGFTKFTSKDLQKIMINVLKYRTPSHDDVNAPKVYVKVGENKHVFSPIMTDVTILGAVSDLINQTYKNKSDKRYPLPVRMSFYQQSNYGYVFMRNDTAALFSAPPRLGQKKEFKSFGENFFSVCYKRDLFVDVFNEMSKVAKLNNALGRKLLISYMYEIVNHVFYEANRYKEHYTEGWTDDLKIPFSQKVLIDKKYIQSQKYEWKDDLSEIFLDWILNLYDNTLPINGKKGDKLEPLSFRDKNNIVRLFKMKCGR